MEINVNKGIISFSYVNPTTNKNLSYNYDINNGVLKNSKHKETSTITAKKFCIQELNKKLGETDYWGDVKVFYPTTNLTLITFLNFLKYNCVSYDIKVKCIQVANKLDNFNLPNITDKLRNQVQNLHCLNDKNIKSFIQWYNEQPQDQAIYLSQFINYYNEKLLEVKYPFLKDIVNKDEQKIIKNFLTHSDFINKNKVEQDVMMYYYITRGMYKINVYEKTIFYSIFHPDYELAKIFQYIRLCKLIKKTPQKEKDFYREYKDTLTTYYHLKEEYDNQAMYDNYEKQRKAFTFSYGNYEIVIPQNPKDIIREGAEMHHCVGGYVNDVVQNKTYIVFVRNKANLDTPYITAQVGLNGTLGQYFLSYDRKISSREDINFKEAFQKHLNENWVTE